MPVLIHQRTRRLAPPADLSDVLNHEGILPGSGIRSSPSKSANQLFRPALFQTCSNPACRSGWFQLWRSRFAPVFEDGWTCSSECTIARMAASIAREMDDYLFSRETHRHRIPLGLILMQQGSISHSQLRRALETQKATGKGRLGFWLIRDHAVTEDGVTKALGAQWSCPVLPLERHDAPSFAATFPRLFADAYAALPLRLAAAKVLYLGFEEKPDRVLALALERMTGLQVECGIVPTSKFKLVHANFLQARFPSVELVEAVSLRAAACALARSIEKARPLSSRLVRVHDCLWLRMWLRPQVNSLPDVEDVMDVVCSIGRLQGTDQTGRNSESAI